MGLGDTQKALLLALLHAPEGLSVDDLVVRLDVTRTAVRQHLGALESSGLVNRSGSRPTGHRPEHLYALTDHGRAVFPKQYPLLANLLIGEVATLLGPERLIGMMRLLGEDLARGLSNVALEEEKIVEHMSNTGYEAAVFYRGNGEKEIHAHNCVFHDIARDHPEVCELDLALIGKLGQAEVEHKECMVRGGARCRFVLRKEA